MRRWSFFLFGIISIGSLLFFAVRMNTKIAHEGRKTEAGIESAAAPETEGSSVENSLAEEPVPAPEPVQVAAEVYEEKIAESQPVPEPEFMDSLLKGLQLYRQANQTFLNEDLSSAGTGFGQTLGAVGALPAHSAEEQNIKDNFVQAVQARIDSVSFFSKVVKEPDSPQMQQWWDENVALLKKANEAIAQTVRLAAELIRAQSEKVGDEPAADLLLQDLQKSAKGVLVVSKNAQS